MLTEELSRTVAAPNNLEAFWMPFTANRHFKLEPRLIARAKDFVSPMIADFAAE